MRIFKFGPAGRIKVKGEHSAPVSWKNEKSFIEKLLANELLPSINIHDENNIKEIKFFLNKKFYVIGINIFLFSFSFSLCKDIYTISKSLYNIYQIDNIDFTKIITPSFIEAHENNLIKAKNDKSLKLKVKQDQKWIDEINNFRKEEFFKSNSDSVKNTILSFANNLFILFMITKYYWKRKSS